MYRTEGDPGKITFGLNRHGQTIGFLYPYKIGKPRLGFFGFPRGRTSIIRRVRHVRPNV